MRKLFITFFLSICLTAVSSGQETTNKFNGGILFGLNASYFDSPITEYSEDYYSYFRTGVVMGLRGTYMLSKVFSLQSELIYTSKGGAYRKMDNSISVIGGDGGEKTWLYKNFQLKYIEIPIMIGVDLTNINNQSAGSNTIDFIVKLGFAPSFNVKSAIRYNEYRETSKSGPMSNVSSEYTTVNFPVEEEFCYSLIGELSLNFNKNGINPMFIDIRYTKTLNNVYTLEHWNDTNMETTVSTFSLIYGFYFRNLISY